MSFEEGSRNDSLYRFGCSLQARGYDDNKIHDEMMAVNQSKCNPPLDGSEVERIYQSVLTKEKGTIKNQGKMILKPINVNTTSDDNNDNKFYLARQISELGNTPFDDYEAEVTALYPYVDVHLSKYGDITYTIKTQRLAAFIRQNENYFFIESVGEKPIPYWYQPEGYYKQCNDLYFLGQIKKYIEIIDEELVEPSTYSKVYKLLQTDLNNSIPAKMLNSDTHIINFQNGIYRFGEGLQPHTPDIYTTIQIPCNYNDDNFSCPVFMQFISTLANHNSEIIQLFLEFIGYAISNIPGYLSKQALILYGPGNTGKSQFLALLERLVGSDNYCSITMQSLEERFGTAPLFGKRIAGSADMSTQSIRELERFKALTGGDIIDFEYKGKDKFDGKFNGLLVFCCNDLPEFGGDKGDHVYDRMIIVHCENVIPLEQRDRRILDKMYEEREGIISKCLLALHMLIMRGGYFYVPDCCKKSTEDYKVRNDTVKQFLIECTTQNINKTDSCFYDWTKTSSMYNFYSKWCEESGYKAENRRGFRKGVECHFNLPMDSIEFIYNGTHYYPFALLPTCREHYRPYS